MWKAAYLSSEPERWSSMLEKLRKGLEACFMAEYDLTIHEQHGLLEHGES
jgi:hypothetical protein